MAIAVMAGPYRHGASRFVWTGCSVNSRSVSGASAAAGAAIPKYSSIAQVVQKKTYGRQVPANRFRCRVHVGNHAVFESHSFGVRQAAGIAFEGTEPEPVLVGDDHPRAAPSASTQDFEFGGSMEAAAASTSAAHTRKKNCIERLPLSEDTRHNLYGMGITMLSEIQEKAFHPIFRGRSFIGRSRTGTGKTIAYLLPILERMRHEKITAPHSVLVLVPSRELCKQVGSVTLSLSMTTNIALVFGGPSLRSQEQLVRMGVSMVVATPGRCARLITNGALQVSNVRVVVIDEADTMLSPLYLGRVERILGSLSVERVQGVFFSASMSPDVLSTIDRFFNARELVDLVDRGGIRHATTVQVVSHKLCSAPKARNERLRVLLHLMATKLDELGGRCIIFVDSTAEAKALLSHPVLDRKASAIHAASTSEDRDNVLNAFINREFDVLITTDILSRGVDFQDVNLVLQFHPPRDAAQYVHRAGRTGRAGSGGVVITLYDPSEQALVQRVREATRQNFRTEVAPGCADMHGASVARLMDELLAVEPEEYGPVLKDAEKMLEEMGPRVLASAMAVLDGRHAALERAVRETPSLLSGARGYVCMIAHDPNHAAADNEGVFRRVILSLLTKRHAADDRSIGRVAKTTGGWAVDISRSCVTHLTDDLRSGRRTAPFELTIAKSLPRLARSSRRGAKRLPWTSLGQSLRKKSDRRRVGVPRGLRTGKQKDKVLFFSGAPMR